MYGFKLLYLEAGSGASTQVNPQLIERARTVEGLTLVIGGGIRTPEQAKLAADAGADWVVTGTLTEDAADLEELRTRISGVVQALK
jgi:phosphoglycerol geranylgeranyltransferase